MTGTSTTRLTHAQSVEIHQTELGNAERLLLVYGSVIRYCYPRRSWYIWDGTRWKQDDTGHIFWLAKQTIRMMYLSAGSNESGIDKGAARHAIRSETSHGLEAMVELARSEEGVPIIPLELDADPWQLNVQNGCLDLRAGELGKHEKGSLITKLAPVDYDASAQCPGWLSFLDRILGGNAELIAFLQRAVGYTLTGDTSEHALFFLYGTGANGKTTFLRTIQAIMGDYACQADPDLLLNTGNPQHPTNIARLEKSRLTICMEVEAGRSMRTSTMKQLTGGDKRTARRMREDFHEYQPTDKIWLGANNKPRIRGQELAIWRRMKLIPFTVTIPEQEQDKHLVEKLTEEASGILNWALEGCQAWQVQGALNEPGDVKTATADYKSESDPLRDFLDDCCIVDPDSKDTSARLYNSYTRWAEKEGLKKRETLSHNMVSRRLAERFQKEAKVPLKQDGSLTYRRGFKGIRVKGMYDEVQDSENEEEAYEQQEIPF